MNTPAPIPAARLPRSRWSALRGAVALALSVGVLCWLSLEYTRQPHGFANLWAATGFFAGVLITSNASRWPAYIVAAALANLAARLVHNDPLVPSSIVAMASTFDAVAVAYAIRRYAGRIGDIARIVRLAQIATLSTIAASAASGVVATLTMLAIEKSSFAPSFFTWLIVHSTGMVIFATLTVVARVEGRRLFGRRGERRDLVLTIGVVASVSIGVFAQSRYPLLFLVPPVALLAAFRHRFSGFVLGMTVVTIVALVGTLSGHGPLMLSVSASPAERTFVLQLFIATSCALTLPVAVVLTQRKWLERRLSNSESNYRLLADYSRDLVVRIDSQGRRKYVSPAAKEILGWEIDELREERWDLVHPDDRGALMVAMAKLRVEGGTSTVVYRVQHRKGHYVSIEAHARLVPSTNPGEAPDIIYAGRDISRRVKAEQDLARNQRRLRAIADNTPAFVVHVNTEERYTFANSYAGKMLGIHPTSLIGRAVKNVATEKTYAEIKPRIDAALRGETVTFESERVYGGVHHIFQCTYVPDRTPDGEIVGFYGMVFDISNLKYAERELAKLARNDSLTGVANRFQFNERMALAVARRQRRPSPLALLYLDIDHFKVINDTQGHAAGDAILIAFAQRLRECVRDTDLVARLGGDEFVVLLEDVDTPEVARAVARKLVERLAPGIVVEGSLVKLTTSIGIAFRSHPVARGDELMKIADDALYEAKAAGRNTYRMVDDTIAVD